MFSHTKRDPEDLENTYLSYKHYQMQKIKIYFMNHKLVTRAKTGTNRQKILKMIIF